MNTSDAVRFHIEKTHAAMYDADRAANTAAAQLIVLLTLATLLAFGAQAEDQVAVPFIGLNFQKWDAVYAVLVLSAAVAYRYVNLSHLQSMLTSCLRMRLKSAGWNQTIWSVSYPGIDTYWVIDGPNKRLKSLASSALNIAAVLGPLSLLLYSGSVAERDGLWAASLIMITFLMIGTAASNWGINNANLNTIVETMEVKSQEDD